jgi:hypothetical protein
MVRASNSMIEAQMNVARPPMNGVSVEGRKLQSPEFIPFRRSRLRTSNGVANWVTSRNQQPPRESAFVFNRNEIFTLKIHLRTYPERPTASMEPPQAVWVESAYPCFMTAQQGIFFFAYERASTPKRAIDRLGNGLG